MKLFKPTEKEQRML